MGKWGSNDGWNDPESYEIEARAMIRDAAEKREKHKKDMASAKRKAYNDALEDAANLVMNRSPGSLGHKSLSEAILALKK